jgi:hypothetical protein
MPVDDHRGTEIHDQQIGTVTSSLDFCTRCCLSFDDTVLLSLQQDTQYDSYPRIVLDDQDLMHRAMRSDILPITARV